MIKLVDLGRQHESLKDELRNAIDSVIDASAFVGGSAILKFEQAFAEFCGTKEAVGLSNGTSAIEVALRALGVGHGDQVITVSNTFFATVEAIYNVGATPVFVDVNASDGLMNLNEISSVVTKKSKLILPVHLWGNLVNMPEVIKIAQSFDLLVLEDAAQAHGSKASWGGPGQLSSGATFSFYPGKNLGAMGDAGGFVTNDTEIAGIVKKLRDHGRMSKYEHDLVGGNARMDGIQAAVLDVKLTKLHQWNSRRREIAEIYTTNLENLGFKILNDKNAYESAWHLFVVRVKNRHEVLDYMHENEIEAGIHYPIPLHQQPALMKTSDSVRLPITEQLAGEIVSLPIHPFLEHSEQLKILEIFNEVAERV